VIIRTASSAHVSDVQTAELFMIQIYTLKNTRRFDLEKDMSDKEQFGGKDKDLVDAFLDKPLLARIATVNPDTWLPHVVPVWYGWDGESLWISSYSTTRKVSELKKNPYCSVVIDVAETDGEISALLFEGIAELVTGPADLLREKITWVYTRYLGEDGVLADDPQEWLASPENLLIKLTPAKTYAW
jgi:hypothetical protein